MCIFFMSVVMGILYRKPVHHLKLFVLLSNQCTIKSIHYQINTLSNQYTIKSIRYQINTLSEHYQINTLSNQYTIRT